MATRATSVLILTDEKDRTATRVAGELAERDIDVVRVDACDFPTRLQLSATCGPDAWQGNLHGRTHDGRAVDLALGQVASVYYRRPTQFVLEDGMSGPEREFAYGEARFGFGGVLQSLDCLWLNPAVAAAAAEYKPRQLDAARGCGLRIPRTLITNDPQEANAWASDLGGPFVYKPLSGVWLPEADEVRILYTTVLNDPAKLRDPALKRTAHLFQEWVDKKHEARAVVIGDQVFTIAIHSRSNEGRVDWRADYGSHSYELIELPTRVRDGLIRLHRKLGLLYGACDLVATPDGDWVFLETNPGGEWEWLEGEGGAPIAGAIADVLQKGQI